MMLYKIVWGGDLVIMLLMSIHDDLVNNFKGTKYFWLTVSPDYLILFINAKECPTIYQTFSFNINIFLLKRSINYLHDDLSNKIQLLTY